MSSALKVVMFTDQVGSTQRTSRHTPAEIMRLAREHDVITADAVHQCRGTILKDTGDGAFIEFRSCADAVRCGFILQQRLKARNEAQTNAQLRFELHIGIDIGELVVLPNGDLRGNAANLAARVCSHCPPGEVYFTERVKNELHAREARAVEVGSVELKGVEGKVVLCHLVEWLGAIEPVANPFVWRSVITDPADFFNRLNEQRTVRAYLRRRQNCQIVGPRRIGKTSLLRRIEHAASEWEDDAVVAYFDWHNPQCFTLLGWLGLASRLFRWTPPSTSLAEFTEYVEDMVSQGRRPILCLDEFGELMMRQSEFTRDFLVTLRACGQKGMSIITASQRPLSELTDPNDRAISPFYNTFPLLRLGPFGAADAEDFITLHRPGAPSFTPGEKEAILEFARGHPLALQVACFHILEAKEHGESLRTAMGRAEENMRAHLPVAW